MKELNDRMEGVVRGWLGEGEDVLVLKEVALEGEVVA